MDTNRRIIFSDDQTLIDITDEVSGFASEAKVLPVVAAEDKIYIGSVLPFNHLFFKFDVPNTNAATLSARFWDGQMWRDFVDIRDRTDGFTKDGQVFWTKPRDYGWQLVSDSSQDLPSPLSGITIYDMYWLELSFDADLSGTTELKFVGQKFSDDQELFAFYPDLNSSDLQGQFATGKTDWDEQTIMAAEQIVLNLSTQRVIADGSQLMSPEALKLASIQKTAEMIYHAFGEAYTDDKARAKKLYQEAMNLDNFRVDWNQTGKLERGERFHSTQFWKRG